LSPEPLRDVRPEHDSNAYPLTSVDDDGMDTDVMNEQPLKAATGTISWDVTVTFLIVAGM
jgi:hypothetical protein